MSVETPSSLPGSPEATGETHPVETAPPPSGQAGGAPPETRAFDAGTAADDAAVRPQADFGAPISLDGADGEPPPADDELGVPHVTGGEVPPLYAMADDDAEPRLPEPRVEQPLTRRIHQGMPSYSEPDPEIAGVVGRAARGGSDDPSAEDQEGLAPRDGGTP